MMSNRVWLEHRIDLGKKLQDKSAQRNVTGSLKFHT